MDMPGKLTGKAFLLIAAIALMCGAIRAAPAVAEGAGKQYGRTDLVSNVAGRMFLTDSNLADPWGMARGPEGPWWVADGGKGRVTLYTGEGVRFPALSPLAIDVPVNPGGIHDYSTPSGIVYNGTDDFELAPGEPARFIVVTRDGTVTGWSGYEDRNEAALVADNAPYAAYTGATIVAVRGKNRLFAANFRQGRVEVFDEDFSPMMLDEGAFTSPLIPRGYAPYNVQTIGDRIYVTFAAPDDDGRDALPGEGLGYAAAFDTEGTLITLLEPGPWMNAPWGIALAPEKFGDHGGRVLVANHGSGAIAAFDPGTGRFRDYLAGPAGTPLEIYGLRGLGFGNDGLAGPSDVLYFTAGSPDGRFGLFGAVTIEESFPAESVDEREGMY
jgi:uncharacterized protein (TIGR03118 family)